MTPGAPSRWLVLGVRTPLDEVTAELLTDSLITLGGRAVWEENGRLTTHLPEPDDPEAFLTHARARLRCLALAPDLELEAGWQPHEDWAETWKRGLAPRRITARLVVTPTWETPEVRPGDVVITLDPGMAFGNAEHGTTRGCLRLLDAVLTPGGRVLDVGTGSGVLSIAAALLGAREVVAIEADPFACEVARENLASNGVADRATVHETWAGADTLASLGSFDGVIANIEGSTLRALLPGLHACARPGGWVILSGLLADETDSLVHPATALGLSVEAQDADGEWRSLLLRRGE